MNLVSRFTSVLVASVLLAAPLAASASSSPGSPGGERTISVLDPRGDVSAEAMRRAVKKNIDLRAVTYTTAPEGFKARIKVADLTKRSSALMREYRVWGEIYDSNGERIPVKIQTTLFEDGQTATKFYRDGEYMKFGAQVNYFPAKDKLILTVDAVNMQAARYGSFYTTTSATTPKVVGVDLSKSVFLGIPIR